MSTLKMRKDTCNLKWVRVFSPVHIPKYLVEQVKDRDYSIEDFYKYQEIHGLIPDGKGGTTVNHFNHLYVAVDEENIVKGYLWMLIDPLSKNFFINTYSMDNEYWNRNAMKFAVEHVKELMRKLKLKKAFWLTRYPKHSERHGFKISRQVLMEFDIDEENIKGEKENGTDLNRRNTEDGRCPALKPAAAAAS